MPKQLTPSSVSAPGFYGLNSQRKADVLPFTWATKAENCVIDDSGRIAARKGYQRVNLGTISATAPVRAIHEYIDASGSSLQIFASDNKIWKLDGSATPVNISGTITTPTGDNWEFQNFNGKVVGYQAGHAPISMATISGSFIDIVLSGTQQPTTASVACLASFGRVWVLDGSDLKYSDSLIEGAYSGVFDLSTVWLSGMDVPVALAEFNGHLVIFGKQSIVVYSNPYDPVTADVMVVVENIGGIGCIARDSIQHIGNDILFLSGQGIRSLGRVVQEKSMPINDVSRNVNDDLNALVSSETLANIKSGYSKAEGFYIITLPTSDKTYYFDLRQKLEDGSYKVATWQTGFTGVHVTSGGVLYLGSTGFINKYSGYKDAVLNDGTGGTNYTVVYESGWNDVGIPAVLKIPKKLAALLLGGNGQTVLLKWAVDFVDEFHSFSKTISVVDKAEYNIAEYNVSTSEYAGGTSYNRIKTPMSHTGQLIKFGINIEVSGGAVAIQQIDMHSKLGRAAI